MRHRLVRQRGGGNYVVAVRAGDPAGNRKAERAYEIRQSATYGPTSVCVGEWLEAGWTLTANGIVAWLPAMFDKLPTPPLPPHVVGEGYEFADVRSLLGGQTAPPHFVIHRDGVILGLCLGLTWNPLAESDPCEVWVGRKGELPKWGTKLAESTGPLPVYVRREEGGKWFFTGLYEVTGSSTEPDAIQQRLKPPVITRISRIVFLKRSSSVPWSAAAEGESPPQLPAPEPSPSPHPRDPLYGVTLETIVNGLVERHGWAEMAQRVPIRCFLHNPSVKSSLTFLRKTPWARQKVEGWFISEL